MARIYRKKEEKELILKKSIDFFNNTGYLPEYNRSNSYETKLYNKRITISYEDLDKNLVEKYKSVKLVHEKRLFIDKAIKAYYNFYLKNGRFPVDSPKNNDEERSISKAYTRYKSKVDYHTYKQERMFNMINEIKRNRENRNKLRVIKDYIDYYENHDGNVPLRRLNKKTVMDRYENNLAARMHRIDLNKIYIPYLMQIKLYEIINSSSNEKANSLMLSILYFIEDNKCSPYCRSKRTELISYGSKNMQVSSAINYVHKNLDLVDNELIKTYNELGYSAPKTLYRYNLNDYMFYTVLPDNINNKRNIDFNDSLEKIDRIISNKYVDDKDINMTIFSGTTNEYSSWKTVVLSSYPSLLFNINYVDNEIYLSGDIDMVHLKGKVSIEGLSAIGVYVKSDDTYFDKDNKKVKGKVDSIYELLDNHRLDIPVIDLNTGYILKKK